MSQVFFLRVSQTDPNVSIIIDKSSSLTRYTNMADAVNALDVPKYRVADLKFDIHRASMNIAKNSRRGIGRTIYSPAVFSVPDNIMVFTSTNYKRTILCYQGSSDYDQTFLQQNGGFYIHPDADKMAYELIF